MAFKMKGMSFGNDHNIHARKTEGSKFRQWLRSTFGKNRPYTDEDLKMKKEKKKRFN